MSGLDRIIALLGGTDEIVDRLAGGSPSTRDAFRERTLMVVAGAYAEVFGSSVEAPDWIPYLPYYFARLAPNPDTVNAFVPIDPAGSYRFTGSQGTETIATITLRKGGPHLGERCGARVDEIDLMALETDADGRFDFVMSPTRPDDPAQQWFPLHPETTCLMLRRVLQTPDQVDGTCGIVRLDRPAPRLALTPPEREAKFDALARYARAQSEFLLHYMNHLRASGAEAGFVIDDQTDYGGLVSQIYHFHLFDLAEDEVLLLESEAPAARYWSVQVIDPTATTLDYVLHQSSLNDAQTRVDADGRVRIVLSPNDPGVDNWLDSSGWREGGIIWRWNDATPVPEPTVTKLKRSALRDALPAETRWLDPTERRASLGARAAFYQERRR